MREVDVPLPVLVTEKAIGRAVKRSCDDMGLSVGAQTTLSRYAGSLHWHIRRPGARGTLEVTFAPKVSRLWFAIHSGRDALWIDEVIETLAARITSHLTQPEPPSRFGVR